MMRPGMHARGHMEMTRSLALLHLAVTQIKSRERNELQSDHHADPNHAKLSQFTTVER